MDKQTDRQTEMDAWPKRESGEARIDPLSLSSNRGLVSSQGDAEGNLCRGPTGRGGDRRRGTDFFSLCYMLSSLLVFIHLFFFLRANLALALSLSVYRRNGEQKEKTPRCKTLADNRCSFTLRSLHRLAFRFSLATCALSLFSFLHAYADLSVWPPVSLSRPLLSLHLETAGPAPTAAEKKVVEDLGERRGANMRGFFLFFSVWHGRVNE